MNLASFGRWPLIILRLYGVPWWSLAVGEGWPEDFVDRPTGKTMWVLWNPGETRAVACLDGKLIIVVNGEIYKVRRRKW